MCVADGYRDRVGTVDQHAGAGRLGQVDGDHSFEFDSVASRVDGQPGRDRDLSDDDRDGGSGRGCAADVAVVAGLVAGVPADERDRDRSSAV
jgi:hypothetical protein